MNPLGKASTEQLKFSPNLNHQDIAPEIKIAYKTELLGREVLSNSSHATPPNKSPLESSLMSPLGMNFKEKEILPIAVNINDAVNAKEFNEMEEFDFEFGDVNTFDGMEQLDDIEESSREAIKISEDSSQVEEEIASVSHKLENAQTHEDESLKKIKQIDTNFDVKAAVKSNAALDIKNLYRFEGNFALNTVSFSKMINKDDMGRDIHQSSDAFSAKNYILADFASGKAFVAKGSDIPVGMQIELEGHILTIEHLTEEQEHNLAAQWENHMASLAPKPEEIKEEHEEKLEPIGNKSNYDTTPLSTKLTNGANPSSWVKNHLISPMSISIRENSLLEKKNKYKSAVKDEIQKEELKSEILKKGIKKNAIETDSLKNSIVLVQRINHNNIRSEHRLGIIPTLCRKS